MIRAAAVAFTFGCIPAPARAPSDAAVRRAFAAHRASFEGLRDLLLAEPAAREVGFDRIGDCFFESGRWRCEGVAVGEAEALRRAQLPSSRYQRYRALLTDAGARHAARSARGVEIVLHSAGISVSGVVKEVRWSLEPIEPLVDDTDAPSTGWHVNDAALDGAWTIERRSN